MVGTVHYASVNLLQGISTYWNHSTTMRFNLCVCGCLGPSRRDDLESLAYTLVWILRGKVPWEKCSKSVAKKLKATMTGSVLFSGLPSELAEFYDYVRGLKYEEDPDYDRWMGIFHEILAPYTRTEEPFDFASARDFEDIDEYLTDGSVDWPKFSTSNSIEDNDSVEDNDEDDCGSCASYRYSGFMPNSSWPDPAGVKEEELFGDEDKMLKGRVDIVSTPPSILEGGYVDIVNADDEKMILI